LQSIPGVGVVTADVILSELADWKRFSSLKKVTAYSEIVPGQRESAGKRKALHIEKAGSALLRCVLTQAAWQLVRRPGYWAKCYLDLKSRIGAKKAITAIARRLLGVSDSLQKQRRPYVKPQSARPPKKPRRTTTKSRSAI